MNHKTLVHTIGLAGALLISGTATAANTPSQLKPQHEAAARALQTQDWAAAAQHYREILKSGPEDSLAPNAQFGLAESLAGAGKTDEAIEQLEATLRLIADLAAGKKLNGQQSQAGWQFTVKRRIGRLLEAQDKPAEAARMYLDAAEGLGRKRDIADWRAWARIDAANALHAAGKTADAVALLEETTGSLSPPEFAGMRCYLEATLARIHRLAGDSERSKAVLSGIESDPQLDARQRAAAAALAAGKPFEPVQQATGTLSTRRGGDYLAIVSEGRYELRIALQETGAGGIYGVSRYGWITAWYNLEDDPFKKTNLAGLSFFPLLKPHHLGFRERNDAGEWKSISSNRKKELSRITGVNLGMKKGPDRDQPGQVRFEILEESPARIRTRTSHDTWPFDVYEYTFYPTGQVFVGTRFHLRTEEPVPLRLGAGGFYTAKNTRVNWAETVEVTSRMSGEGGHSFPAPFVLARSNAIPSFQISMPDDILTCLADKEESATFINNEISLSWRRAPLRFDCDFENRETQEFALQLRVFPRDIDSFEIAETYVSDYRNPPKIGLGAGGRIITDSPGDRDGDGYNESRGCHMLSAKGGPLKLSIDAGGQPRFQPAFEIAGWTGEVPARLKIDGVATDRWSAARTAEDTVVIQVLDQLGPDVATLEIE